VALKLYADECVDARIVAGLRRRGVDVHTAAEQGLLADAAEILEPTDMVGWLEWIP
jgi:hypothetical protein